ncbi:MAG: type II toxin-antitoxin system YafQ family toxin [Candidatus Pacebacteria bacterium]|nr:type II toxin-antitoxin system YafQ family toxin [Candidatus Paceibacterota bacterium]
MFNLKYSSQFKKDLKNYKNEQKVSAELEKVLDILIKGDVLPNKYHNHPLKGSFKDCLECHIKPDIILIYKKEKSELIVLLLRVGSHSNIF